jgi:hypothetical protein
MKRIPADKWRHFEVGCEMALLFQFLLQVLFPHYIIIDCTVTLVVICIVGYGFELYSLVSGNGHYELMDAVAVLAGGVVGLAAAFVLHFI